MNKDENISYESLSVLRFLYKWRWHFIAIGVIAALSSAIFSGPAFIKPKYKSLVVFFPSKVNSVSTVLRDEGFNQDDPLAFGEEEEAEQLIQILHSDNIRDSIISKFDLMNHYDIEANSSFRFTQLYKEYNSNISFRRTEYMSVEIKVLDTDPVVAASIANDIATLLDATKNEIQGISARKAFIIVKAEYERKKRLITSLSDSLNALRRMGIFDYQLQVDNLNSQYVKSYGIVSNEKAKLSVYLNNRPTIPDSTIVGTKARIKGAEQTLIAIQLQLDKIGKYGGPYILMSEELELENEEFVSIRERFQKARVNMEETLPVKFVVNNARVAEKKSYPIRWLIVALSTLGSLLLGMIIIVFVENLRSFKK